MRARFSSAAFTLIELITVLAIVAILTANVVNLAGFATQSAERKRAVAEMAAIQSALESYRGDFGGYPREVRPDGSPGATDQLSPKRDFDPTSSVYEAANLSLYAELTGDKSSPSGAPDGIPDPGEKRYLDHYDFNRMVKVDRDARGAISKVHGFQDPWGFLYGYSTAAAAAEQQFQQDLRGGKAAARKTGDDLPGYNSATFDLWSTAGQKSPTDPSDPKAKESAHARWVKNW